MQPASIRWRAEFDKRGRERIVPIPETLAEEIRSFQLRLKGVGDGWVFQRETKDGPWARETFGQLLVLAESKAGLPGLKGGRWHAYRRKWATERKDQPIVDVMAAGGWRDLRTLTTSYQQADDETMLQVMASPVKLMGRKAVGNG